MRHNNTLCVMGEYVVDFIVRVTISVNGLAEEEFDLEVAKKIRESSHIQYPDWVDPSYVAQVRNLKCFELVRELLLSGNPTIEVARHIHLLNEWTEKKLDTVRQYLEHFKTTLPKAQMLARMVPASYPAVKKRVDQQLNCADALTSMYHLMMDRIAIQVKREKDMQFLLPNTEKQFAVALEIVCRLNEIQKDMKVDTKEIEIHQADSVNRVDWGKVYNSPGANDTMKHPEKRARLVRFVETMAKVGGALWKQEQEKIIESLKQKVEGE